MNDKQQVAEQNAPARYQTEAECRAEFKAGSILTLHLVLISAALKILSFGSWLGCTSFALALFTFITIDAYRRWRRIQGGAKIPVPNTSARRPVSTLGIAVDYFLLTATTVMFTVLIFSRFLPALTQTDSLAKQWAGGYLTVFFVACLFSIWRATLAAHRNYLRRRAVSDLILSTVAQPSVSENATVVPSPRHWWTNTDTREEIQQNLR